tara:strand:- start:478 stop:849 length:372 start_codon:yes stop_codon:yes gene_type:complete
MAATGVVTKEHNQKIASMIFSEIYSCYVTKIEKKERTEKELKSVITWLTGFEGKALNEFIKGEQTLKEFFSEAQINPKAKEIKGVICGYRIEEIKSPLTKKCRYLDKLVDELAKGKPLEKIFR